MSHTIKTAKIMEKQNEIKIVDEKKVRALWDAEQEKWYFSIVDVIVILTDRTNFQGGRNYWKVLKHRLLGEGMNWLQIATS